MQLKERKENPIVIYLSEENRYILTEDGRRPTFPGCMYGGDHFGFEIIQKVNGKKTTTSYTTQSRIDGVQEIDNIIHIYEQGKMTPWSFDKKGNLLEVATFLEISRRDIAYLEEQGIARSELPKINKQRVKKFEKRKRK